MATQDEREKEKEFRPTTLGKANTGATKGRVKVSPEEIARAEKPLPEINFANKDKSAEEIVAEKAHGIIDQTTKAEGKPGLADTFKEIAPFLIGTALGGLDAGFAAQSGALQARAAMEEGELSRRKTEAQISALEGKAASQHSRDPNSPASVSAREKLKVLAPEMDITDDMTEADVYKFGGRLMTRATTKMTEEERTARFKENMEFKLKEAERREQKEKSLSSQQTEKMAGFKDIENKIQLLDELSGGVDTGPVSGRFQSVLEIFGASSPEFTMLKNTGKDLTLSITKAMQGARPSDLDLQFIQAMVPKETDQDNVFAAKLDLLNKMAKDRKINFMNAISTGEPLKKDVIAKFLSEDAEAYALASKINAPVGALKRTDTTDRMEKIRRNEEKIRKMQEELRRRANQ